MLLQDIVIHHVELLLVICFNQGYGITDVNHLGELIESSGYLFIKAVFN